MKGEVMMATFRLFCGFELLALLLALGTGCGGSGNSTPDAGPPPINQCTNANDLAIAQSLLAMSDAGMPDGGFPDGGPYPASFELAIIETLTTCTNQMCVTAFLTETNADQCVADCVQSTPAAGLSVGCTGCQNEAFGCIVANCLNLCLGSDMSMCNACIITNCSQRIADCTGFEQIQ